MRFRSYHREIEKCTAQLLDLLNDITIDRRNSKDIIQQTIRVPCLYAGRSRILKSLENRSKNVSLPVMAISITGISRDSQRAHSIHDGLQKQSGGTYDYLKNTPTPITLTYSLFATTKFQEDMDQILTNFVPFFNNELYVVIPHPINAGQYLKPQIVWSGDLVMKYPEDVDKNSQFRIEMSTTFTIKTWLFPGMTRDDGSGKLIRRINFNAGIGFDTDGVGKLQGFWPVPSNQGLDTFAQNIVCGFIDMRNYSDQWQISGSCSGLWHDISGLVTGNTLGIQVSGDPCFLTTTDGGLLLITNRCYLPKNMSNISIDDYWNYYQSCLTGDLFDYQINNETTISN